MSSPHTAPGAPGDLPSARHPSLMRALTHRMPYGVLAGRILCGHALFPCEAGLCRLALGNLLKEVRG